MSTYLIAAILTAIPQSDTGVPIWLTTASTRNLPRRTAYEIELLKQYGVYTPPSVPQPPGRRAALDDNSLTGSVSRVLTSGLTLSTYVSTHSRPEAIERLIESQISRYETQYGKDRVRVDRKGDTVSVYTAGGAYNLNGMQASSPPWENHYRFSHGIFATSYGLKSRKQLLGLAFAEIRKKLNPARGKDTYARYEPDSDDRKRIDRFKEGLSFKHTFGLPRQLHWIFSETTEATLAEYFAQLQSVEMWEKLPAAGKPYEFHLELKPRPQTQLARVLAELRPTTQIHHATEGAIGAATIHLRIPGSLRFLVENLVTIFLQNKSPVAKALIEREELTVAAHLHDSATGPIVRAQVAADVSQTDIEHAVSKLQNIESNEPAVEATFVPELLGQRFDRQRLWLASGRDCLRLSIGPTDQSKQSQVDLRLKPCDKPKDRVQLVAVALDLKPWFAEEPKPHVSKLVHRLETVFVRGWVGRIAVDQRDPDDRGDFEWPNYKSLRDRANPSGDWHACFSMSVDSEATLRVDCSMGADLYGFLLVRRKTFQ
ncbi:MAG: hypothetical protein AB8G99_21790 [Planctomycetaceae bacterium]